MEYSLVVVLDPPAETVVLTSGGWRARDAPRFATSERCASVRELLRRSLLLSIVVWALAWPAAGAAPASNAAAVAFAVTVEGSQRTVVTGVRSGVDELGCVVRRAHVDRQALVFSSRGERRIVVGAGRPAVARVPVAIRVSGTRRTTRTLPGDAPECDLAPQTSERECGPAAVAGTAVVRLTARGGIRVAGWLARRRDVARCAPAVGPARAFLTPSEGFFRAALLDDPTAVRIVLRGDARFTDTLRRGVSRVTVVRWTVVLRRLS